MGFDKPLITGGNGQLGRAFRRLLPQAVILSRAELDVTDPRSIEAAFDRNHPDVVVNTAAYTKVDQAESEPLIAENINAIGPRLLAEACDVQTAKLVHVSTDYVFDGNKRDPYREDDDPNPRSVYGSTKLAGERAAALAMHHLIVRTSWVFGDGNNFVATIVKAGTSREELSVVDDQIGRLTYAPDLAKGLWELIQRDAQGLFHLTNQGDPVSWADVAEAALEIAGVDCKVNRISTAEYFEGRTEPIAARPAYGVLDCSKAKGSGVELRPWRDALAEYL